MTRRLDTIQDLTPDARNANKGTEYGRSLLETSLRKYGAGRSVLADKHGNLIAGNKTVEVAAELGLPIRTIETDGAELVVVQRRDLDLASDPAARELAYVDNRAGELSLAWDVAQLAADVEAGVDLKAVGFSQDDLAALLAQLPDGFKEYDESIAGGLTIKARWTLTFPQEATGIVTEALLTLKESLPELAWKEDTTV